MSESGDLDPEIQALLDETLGDVSDNGHVDSGFFEGIEYSVAESLPPEELKEESTDSPFGDITSPVGDGSCNVCGAPTFRPPGLTESGRKKRVPKYCDLHGPNARVSPDRSNLKGVESQLQRVQAELADDLRLLATLAGPLLPVTGMYLFEQADPFTIAIIKLAKNNQKVLRVLHRAAQVAPIYTVAETIAGTAYAVQVDTRSADPHNMIAKRLRVERAYNAIYESEETQQAQPFSGPPKYAMQ